MKALDTLPQFKVIAAIPAYNEANHIASIIKETEKYVDQVLVIDDGSTDGTGEIAARAGATVIKHDRNQGKGTAIDHAFEIARGIQPAAMVLLDGDGQHDPAEIPSLLEPVLNGEADMVVGSRFLRNNHIPKYRMLGLTILTLTTNIGTGIRISDTQSGFRSFSQQAINKMSFRESGFAVESEMQFKARHYNLSVTEVPIATNYDEKVKRSPVAHGFGVLFRVINLIFNHYVQSFHKFEADSSKDKMDIVFIGSRGVPAKYGGNETFVDEVSKRLVNDGLRIGVVCEGRKFFKDSFNGITRIHTYSFQSNRLTIPFINDVISSIYLLLKYNKETNIFYYVTPDGSIAGMIARMFRKKVIVNTDGVEWKRLIKRKKYVPFYQVPIYTITMMAMYFAEYLACKISHVTVADSLEIKKHLARHSPKSVVYIPYGARDLRPANCIARSIIDETLKSFGVESEQYYLTIGRIVPENNIHLEIEGFSNAIIKKKLLIVGNFNNKSCYIKYLDRLKGNNRNILFHDPVYDQKILGILREHCFGYIHAYEVGGTNPSLLEQMLFGKPILAYNVAFNKEVLQQGGIYFETVDDLRELIISLENNEIDLEYLNAQQQLRLNKQYNWEVVTEEYEKLFKGIDKECNTHRKGGKFYGRDAGIYSDTNL